MSTRNEPLLVAPDWGTDALAVVDLTAPEAPEVRFTTVGRNPRAVAVSTDGTRAYVVDHDDETLSVVDLTAPEHPVLPPVPTGKGPCGVVAGLVDDQICVASADGKVEVFDKEGRGGQALTVGTGPCALAAAPGGGARRVCVISETDAKVSVVDVGRAGAPSVSASVSVPGVTRAAAVAPGGRFAYVASRGEGTADGRVTVLDLDADGAAVGDPVPVGAEPRALAIGPTGDRLGVANYGSASVSVAPVDPDSGRVGTPDTVPAGAHPVAVAFAPDGEVIHVVSQTSGLLTAVRTDTLDHMVVPLGGVPAGVVFGPDGHHSYVTDQATGRLTVVRAAPRKSASIPAGEGSKPVDVAVSPDGTWAYAADSASHKVAVLDLGGLAPLAPVPLGATHQPWGVAVAPDLGFACATSPDSSHLLVLSPAQGSELTANGEVTVTPVQLASGARPYGVAVTPDSRYAVTADSGTATVSFVDPKGGTHTIDAEVVGCQEPTGAALSGDGRTLYVSDFASTPEGQQGGQIAMLQRTERGEWQQQGVIDATTGHLSGPHELALSPDELRLYVANYQNGTVSVLNRDAVGAEWGHEMTVTKSPTPLKRPNGLALSPDGTTLYVSNNTSSHGTVEVFDVSTAPAVHQRTIQIVIRPDPQLAVNVGLALSPDGHYLYAADAERWKQGAGALGTVYGIQLAAGGDQMETVATAPAARTDRPGALVCRDDRTLYVVNQGRKESPDPREACLAVITLDASRLGVESTESRPLDKDDLPYAAAISADGTLCVANFTSRTVSVFGSKVTPVPVGEPGASQPWDVAVTADGAYAYVTDRTADSLRCVRLSDHHVTSLDVGRDPMGVACAPGGPRAYVANHGSDSISVIGPDDASPGTPKVIDTWEHPRVIKPEALSVSADGAWLFVTTENSGDLLMLDARTGTPRFTVPAGERLTGSAPHPQSAKHLVYLADEAGAAVSVVDTTTLAPLDTTTPLGLDVRQAVGMPTTN
ncbi:YncE family protein [Streptomyces syringium]|uniref:DNA-binding beta-propeller fold protein YncE n=1 Tax=Streptomyces syringium TaxID=76729 RepID=A0ABS4YBW7_9ACTN|nr:YncE family protein [Streptomyces syringium]MBP2406155.1 DNA-binding beta-propeller fold protein YncE [Streptomyces syringium]